jgi:hypothetical protein
MEQTRRWQRVMGGDTCAYHGARTCTKVGIFSLQLCLKISLCTPYTIKNAPG